MINKAPKVVAHRGASGWAPETTLAAYCRALEFEADFVELDVHRTRDGEIVAIHDAAVDRTTNGQGRIADLSLAQLKELDAGSWFNEAFPERANPEFAGQKIPTLQEVIDLVKEADAGLYIEIKNPKRRDRELECSLVSMIRRNRFSKRLCILSFSAQSIAEVKSLDPFISTALLADRSPMDAIRDALALRADEVAIRHILLTPRIVKRSHEMGLTIAAWTVDREKDLRRMIALGVDRIITNYPDRLHRLLVQSGYANPDHDRGALE